ncbi:MAG: SDR family oxidoreductase [Chloroflexaceae bacterium]|jgi:NAD(P)-dependent dehydrogenase (short-subunit alcohol dehydrogenase family)|nr:SDR family oxidoreductase [Chloroflexaceae bacterium]
MNTQSKVALGLLAGFGLKLAADLLKQRKLMDFRDRVVVITGGSRGLGLVMAREFAREGAKLALLARNAEELERARKELSNSGADAITIPCDVQSQEQFEAAIQRTMLEYGRVDVLVNNAGIITVSPFDHLTVQDFEQSINTHLMGPLYGTLAVLPHMRRQGGGRIINISSIGGQVSVPHLLPYCTGKFALVGFSDGSRAELARDHIYVTTVCPGLMRTGSHYQVQLKGHHEAELAWFSIFDALPIMSMDARRAARQIVDACRRGDPQLTITIQAQILARLNALFPDLMAANLSLMNRLLPRPDEEQGDEMKMGFESKSPLVPSVLTTLADEAAKDNNALNERTALA